MVKYTLLARKGYLLRSGLHYLVLGTWVGYDDSWVILEHGQLTPTEYRQICSQKYVNVYQHTNLHIVSITVPYDQKYFNRQSDHSKLLQYIGCLKRSGDHIYTGRLNVK